MDWRHWCNELSESEISWVRANRDSLEYYMHVTSETLVARQNPTDDLFIVYNCIMALLHRLDGPLPEDYMIPIPEGW